MQLDGPELVKIYWKNNEGREMLVYSSDNAETIPCMREMQLNAEEFEQCLAFFWWNMYILFFQFDAKLENVFFCFLFLCCLLIFCKPSPRGGLVACPW